MGKGVSDRSSQSEVLPRSEGAGRIELMPDRLPSKRQLDEARQRRDAQREWLRGEPEREEARLREERETRAAWARENGELAREFLQKAATAGVAPVEMNVAVGRLPVLGDTVKKCPAYELTSSHYSSSYGESTTSTFMRLIHFKGRWCWQKDRLVWEKDQPMLYDLDRLEVDPESVKKKLTSILLSGS